ncbi:MAG: sulfotransferase [Candidatus Hodarchaeota archaeon]
MLRSVSDITSFIPLIKILVGLKPNYNICVKPMDFLYPQNKVNFYKCFDKFLWIARDPRDSYLSAIESGYAYLFWPHGKMIHGIDVGLLIRWRPIYQHCFEHTEIWYLVKYEDLVVNPNHILKEILNYLGLPYESLLPFRQFHRIHGGDYKIRGSSTITSHSLYRYKRELTRSQIRVINNYLSNGIRILGY